MAKGTFIGLNSDGEVFSQSLTLRSAKLLDPPCLDDCIDYELAVKSARILFVALYTGDIWLMKDRSRAHIQLPVCLLAPVHNYELIGFDKDGKKLKPEGDGLITVHPHPLPTVSKPEELIEYPSVAAAPELSDWQWGTALEGCIALSDAISDGNEDDLVQGDDFMWTCSVDPETGIAYTWWFGEDHQK